MTDPIPPKPVPPLVLASEFPTNADRNAGLFNAKSVGWAQSENAMATRTREIAVTAHDNAVLAQEAALATHDDRAATSELARQTKDARDQAVPAAAQAKEARDQVVPAVAQVLDAARRVEEAVAGVANGPVTSVMGKTGIVDLTEELHAAALYF